MMSSLTKDFFLGNLSTKINKTQNSIDALHIRLYHKYGNGNFHGHGYGKCDDHGNVKYSDHGNGMVTVTVTVTVMVTVTVTVM